MSKTKRMLEEEGYRFNFFQAIKLIEDKYPKRPRVGHLGPFDKEVVRIAPSTDLCFSPTDIHRIERTEQEDGQTIWNLYENFLGLYGPNAATPIFIAEMIAQCPEDDDALRSFLDIFNHRLLSLYYRAWKKHNLAASIEAGWGDPVSVALGAMIGRDPLTPPTDWLIPPERLLRYANYFSSSNRPAAGLESLLSDYFELDTVRVIQFVPRKFRSRSLRQSQLGGTGKLGESFVLGDTINDITGQYKIRIENLSRKEFDSFQPGTHRFGELRFLANLYTRHQLDFRLELVLKPGEGGPARISNEKPIGALGRSAWIGDPSEHETVATLDVDSRDSDSAENG